MMLMLNHEDALYVLLVNERATGLSESGCESSAGAGQMREMTDHRCVMASGRNKVLRISQAINKC